MVKAFGQRDLKGATEAWQQVLRNRLMATQRAAQVAAEGPREEGEILHGHRPVEREQLAEARHLLWLRVNSGHERSRIARDET